jgi:hypothetical protein
MKSSDQNDEARRRTEEGYADQERRDNFFRCGGYDHLPAMTTKQKAAERTKFEDHADLMASREFGEEKDAEIL